MRKLTVALGVNAHFRERQRPTKCIYCSGSRVWWVGSYSRTASVLDDGEVAHLTGLELRRARCAACRDSWVVRLLELFPGRHFQLDVVAEAVARYLFNAGTTQQGVAAWAKCSARTLRRWVRWIGDIATPSALVARLTELTGQPVRLNMPVVRNGGEKVAAHRSVLERAGWNLTLLEGLGRAIQLEPPGLRSVLSRIVGDRAGVTTYRAPSIPELAQRQMGCGFETLYA